MPPLPAIEWPRQRAALAELGIRRVRAFCLLNNIPLPPIHLVLKKDWFVSACAFYRPDIEQNQRWLDKIPGHGVGINICVEHCAHPCTQEQPRAWSWPASPIDRTPYGVLCHELGHHCDWITSTRKGSYGGDYGISVQQQAGEPPLTNYAGENGWEYFAEAMRLFITNPDLLRNLRPRVYVILLARWKPLTSQRWVDVLGNNVPPKLLRATRNKGAK